MFSPLIWSHLRTEVERGREIQRLLRDGTGINKTAATVGVGTATVQRVLAELGPSKAGPRRDAAPVTPVGVLFLGVKIPLDAARALASRTISQKL